ncbi:hypothetical protein B0A49_02900 [Cryomyces minteri]|uniref:BTB domain-containing protein n=1 Tax=Cryomyces minteri TaxID=331657 RepID=A0A4U0XB86_9PEZI|nr:hypothetical protein B0A49_02900 [Cryomyces minteri]
MSDPLSLAVPSPSRPSASRSASSSSIGRAVERLSGRLTPTSHSRDASPSSMQAEVGSPVVEKRDLALPSRPPNTRATSPADLRSGVASPVIPEGAIDGVDGVSIPADARTAIHAGLTKKKFDVHTALLASRSPYFKTLFSASTTSINAPIYFEDLDEFAFALFLRWLYGGKLMGPSDFHGMQHYLCLYVLAQRFEVEALQNLVMDLVRSYYRASNMTAPAYRLEYIYTSTRSACPMRTFLATTAAYRVLCEPASTKTAAAGMSDSVKGVLAKGGELAVDFAAALARLHGNGLVDVRRGADCEWHVHVREGGKCKVRALEPYQNP